jgi:hypothetical protein
VEVLQLKDKPFKSKELLELVLVVKFLARVQAAARKALQFSNKGPQNQEHLLILTNREAPILQEQVQIYHQAKNLHQDQTL